MSRVDRTIMLASSLLLLAINWLAFHDVLKEAPTVRDWLVLVASCLILIEFGRQYARPAVRRG
jgi:hypothetical protein